ncbi:hypothetical protein [Eubacterium sp.]|uniref:hypothetical protein n=1 Tax=uncultured Eubacterium sp. TaxID=165185 RepID=UPI0025EC5275|nr:hypothetical protein [uncultured Eubacterium sp.]
MKKFESPEINVVKFMNADVITTSGGYDLGGDVSPFNLGTFSLQSASDQGGDIPL